MKTVEDFCEGKISHTHRVNHDAVSGRVDETDEQHQLSQGIQSKN